MSLLSRWLHPDTNSRGKKNSGGWEQRVSDLEAAAEGAPLAFKATELNRAGDLSHRSGSRERALDLYGRAVDAFLQDGQPDAARGIAKKIIRVHPEAVRTHGTLTWIDLGLQHGHSAVEHLRDYVRAAQKAGRDEAAADQILLMASVTRDADFLGVAAESLSDLGTDYDADRVRRWAEAGGSPESFEDPLELGEACTRGAMGRKPRAD